jgi:hypothetical protein
MLEAAVRQFTVWGDTDEGRHILIAAARYLAAHSPTEREKSAIIFGTRPNLQHEKGDSRYHVAQGRAPKEGLLCRAGYHWLYWSASSGCLIRGFSMVFIAPLCRER